MKLIDLKNLMTNNLSSLQQQRNLFYQVGDVTKCLELDAELLETELIISKLNRED
jgi:hypothetical protein